MLPEISETDRVEEVVRVFGQGLHGVCQPLTTLQCRLYLGVMDQEQGPMLEILTQCLSDCEQVMCCVRELQTRMDDLRQRRGDTE